MSGRARPAPGAVQVRVLGQPRDIDALAEALTASADVEITGRSGPRANRYDSGQRVYLTVRITGRQPDESR